MVYSEGWPFLSFGVNGDYAPETGGLTTHPLGPASLLGLLGGPVGGGQRGRQGPPQREGRQCPGEALECGWALEGDTHKEIFYVSL